MKEDGEPMFTLTAQDRHGVAVGGCYTNGNQAYNRPIMKGCARAIVSQGGNGVVIKEGEIMKVGNYSPSGHNASTVVNPNGVAPTVMENHGTVTAVVVDETETNKNASKI